MHVTFGEVGSGFDSAPEPRFLEAVLNMAEPCLVGDLEDVEVLIDVKQMKRS